MKKRYQVFVSLFLILFLTNSFLLFSQSLSDDEIRTNLPKMLGASNIGNEYWFTIPPCFGDESPKDSIFFKIFVTSSVKTSVTVEIPGKGFIETQNTIPNGVIEFILPDTIATVWQKHGWDQAPVEQVYRGYGIHVQANDLLIVYVVVHNAFSSGGFLAIPVTSLGRNYIVSSYPDMSAMYMGYLNNSPSESGIIAAYPNTKVKFTLGGNTLTKTQGGLKPGQTVEATLQQGDVWMFATKGSEADLSGSRVSSDKPIGIVSGNYCSNVPTTNRWCDYTCEMDIPTENWGYNYPVGKIAQPKRKYPSIIRIYANENITKIFRNGKTIGQISKGGGKINEAYYEFRMGPSAAGPVSVIYSADKPIGVTLYNTGLEEDNDTTICSSPFEMEIISAEQYQNNITFCTPGINGNIHFTSNYINLIFELDNNGAMPDDYEFGYYSNGELIWEKINKSFVRIDDTFAIPVNGKNYGMKTITLPKDGVYKIRSSKSFTAYSYGYSTKWGSYGYPTTALYKQIGVDDDIPPQLIFTENNGDVEKGTVIDNAPSGKVSSNLSLICFHSAYSYNYDFKYTPFVAGIDNQTDWSLFVKDRKKDARAVITFADRNGNDTTVIFNYKGNPNNVKEESEIDNISIYPNPANDILNIKFSSIHDISYNIYITDLLGKKVMDIISGQIISASTSKEVNIKSLSAGIYYVVFETGNNKKVSQINIIR